MGGHGALICALRHPGRYLSVSAFAPICHPAGCPWGQKAFGHFFGADPSLWQAWDASQLIASLAPPGDGPLPLLVDQGSADPFLHDQLQPHTLAAAAAAAGHPLNLRMRQGYDHSYYFISSFMDDHLRHHATALLDQPPEG
jgi:S-formylglutathione hydrolase